MKYLSLFLIFCIPLFVSSQKNSNAIGARSAALGNSSLLFQDFWAAENNPAGLAYLKKWGGGLSYQSHFLLSEMASKSAVLAYPIDKGALGLSLRQFGYSLYNENKIGLSYGQQLSKTFALGIQLNYLNTKIAENYGSSSGISGNIGLLVKLSDKLQLATLIVNPKRQKLSEYQDERYPSLIKMALGHHFSEKVLLLSEIEKDLDFDETVKIGIEYKPLEILFLRLGYSSNPAESSFGFGFQYEDFIFDISAGIYSELGMSPQVSLSYFPKKSKRTK